MPGENYWLRRKIDDTYQMFQKAELQADEISKLYLEGSRRISFQIQGLFEKFKDKNGLSDAEAKRLLSMMHDPTDMKEAIRLLGEDPDNEAALELKQKLESAAFQNRIYRLQVAQNQLDGLIKGLFGEEIKRTTATYANIANEAYYREIYNIQQRAREAFSFSHLSKKTVDRILQHDWSGAHYSKRVWANTQELGRQLKQEMLLGTLAGKTEKEMADTISERFSVGSMKARRIVRTESAYVFNEMNARADMAAGFDRYRYVATLDLKTSEICRNMDGKEFLYSQKRVGVNYPPLHPWCRSTTMYAWDADILAKMTRRARDPKTGRVVKVPMNMTYHEWMKDKPGETESKQ